MSIPAPKAPTYQDLAALPETQIGEIVAGELHATPRPAGPHAMACSAMGGTLIPPFQFGDRGPGGWWILDEPELHLGTDVVVPDLAGWRRERLPEVPAGPFIDLTPDWICEALSPSTARLDRVLKVPLYARHGVKHLWIVDALAQTLEVFRLEHAHWVLLSVHAGAEVIRAEPFEQIEIRLGRWWGER